MNPTSIRARKIELEQDISDFEYTIEQDKDVIKRMKEGIKWAEDRIVELKEELSCLK